MDDRADADVIAESLRDPGAFAALFERYATTIHQYLMRRVGWVEAEPLMSETFRIAFERRGSYDVAVATARPWLYGIATNLVSRHWRSEARRHRAIDRLEAVDGEDTAGRVVDGVDAARHVAGVARAVRDLPSGERDVIVLRAWEGLEYHEIATALDIPLGTVRSRLHRARRRLHDLTGPIDDHPPQATVFARQKEKLMTDLAGVEPGPWEQRSRMYPRLAYRDEAAALEFLTRAFGFREIREARKGGTNGESMLAWLEFGAGLVMISHSNEDVHGIYSPLDLGNTTTLINVEVDDVDEHYAVAVAEGAEIMAPLRDTPYGARRYEAADLEGHRWHFEETHTHILERGGDVPDPPAMG